MNQTLQVIDHVVPAIASLKPYIPGKPIDELERELGIRNIIKLASNENPLGPSPMALEAVQQASRDIGLYPDGSGFALKNRIAALHQVASSQITLGSGSSDPLEFVVRSFVRPGERVLFSQYAFAIYPIITHAAGGVAVAVPSRNWGYDLHALAAAITSDTRVVFIANPNNPTGTWLGEHELRQFLDRIPHDVLVVVDEAYYEYASFLTAEDRDPVPDCSRWLNDYPNLVVTRTFSKAYGLAGLRIGYSLSSVAIADMFNRIRPPFNVNSLALRAAAAALDDADHLAKTLQVNRDGRAQLMQGFSALGLKYIPTVGNFISVDLQQPAIPVYNALLHHGVIVRPIANYGMPNYLRITIGLADQNQRLLEGLKQILQG
ncbi:MAG: histidinol-phosphate transaminase [Gammaproteobacteria bacterium]|nr:histidinol-phosphate transaminase [Gammaproteobacteria bacterium]